MAERTIKRDDIGTYVVHEKLLFRPNPDHPVATLYKAGDRVEFRNIVGKPYVVVGQETWKLEGV